MRIPLNSQAAFQACQRYSSRPDYDPPDYPECPECESENVEIDKYSFKCLDCGYYSEADFDAILGRD